MDDRTKTVAATSIILGFFLIIIIIVGILLTGKKVLSPVPEEGAIKIIFLTPTLTAPGGVSVSPSATVSVTPTSKTR